MAVIETWLNQDLQKPVKVQYIDGSLFSNNGNGNRIGVELTNNGESYTVTGTVSGYAVLSDGTTVPCTGSKSGNKASILVPPAAYLPGNIFISVFVTDGTTVTTVAAVASTVVQARTDNQVDPGSVVTDWTQTINGAMQDVETAAENLGGIIATPYTSMTFPVPLGKYTYYNDNLYRCIAPISSSESFTAAHWAQVRLGDDVSDLKSAIKTLENNLDEAGVYPIQPIVTSLGHYYIDSNAHYSASSNYDAFLVDVNGLTEIKFTTAVNIGGYYSSVPSVGATTIDNTRHFGIGNGVFTVPSGVKYIVCCNLVEDAVVVKAENKEKPITDEIAAEVEKLETSFESFKNSTTVFSKSKNRFNGHFTDGYYVSPLNGVIAESSSKSVSDFIEIDEKFVISFKPFTQIQLAIYDSTKTFIEGYKYDSLSDMDYDSTLGARYKAYNVQNAKYVVFSVVTANIPLVEYFQIENNTVPTYFVQFNDRYIIKEDALPNLDFSNILGGKILCCVGDSITYGADMDSAGIIENSNILMYQWVQSSMSWVVSLSNVLASYGYQIAERNKMIFYNGGVSGSTVEDLQSRSGFSAINGRYTLLPDNIDYLTIFFGWNDNAYGTLGTINDNVRTTFYGAYNIVLPYLINKYPYTKIALIVPFGTTDNMRNAVRLLANKWGLACFDMFQGGTPLYFNKEPSVGVESSIVTSNRAKFQANGAHPNFKGHYQISTMLENFLRGI